MFTTRPTLKGTFGMAASTHWIASQAAMRMLELGGTAFDAVVAGGFVLQVVQPHLNGPGGDLVALAWDADAGEAFTLCGQGPAPAGATIERMMELGHDLIPGTGLLPAVVPGAFDAWMLLLRDHGRLSLADVLEPALYYAETGMPVSGRLAATISAAENMFRAYWPTSAAVYLPNDAVPQAGDRLANPALAATWRRLLDAAAGANGSREAGIDAARRAWYRGPVADAVDAYFSRETVMDVSGRRNPGLLRGADLAGWSATREDPVFLARGGLRIAKAGPWTQGPVLLQSLAILAEDDISALDPEGPDFVHLAVEAMKLAYADREAYYGDPEHVTVPLDVLLSSDYARARRAAISMTVAADGCVPGAVPGFDRAAASVGFEAACDRIAEAGLLGRYGGGEPTFAALEAAAGDKVAQPFVGDTCTIEVADRFGNMVAATPSGGWLQSSPVIPELGFPMGTRLQSMSLDPDAPSALAPGRRPRTTLTPTLVLDDDGARLAMGTPGGDQQDQWQLTFLLRHLDHGYDLQRAAEAPAFHSEHWPNSFYPRHARRRRLVLGGRWSEAARDDLARRGHDVKMGEPWTEGRIAAVGRDGPFLAAGASPRGMQNYAAGR